MPQCPKCKAEYRDGFETCADCGEPLVANGSDADARPKEIAGPWRWYWQLAATTVLASGAGICSGFVGMLTVPYETPNQPSITAELVPVVMSSVVLASIAILAGYLVGKQWDRQWICLGWVTPIAALYCAAAVATGVHREDLNGVLSFVVLAALGAVSTLLGGLIRARKKWLYATTIVLCLLLAVAALWHFAFAFD